MRSQKLLDGFTYIEDSLIEDSIMVRKSRSYLLPWKSLGAIAACMVFAIILYQINMDKSARDNIAINEIVSVQSGSMEYYDPSIFSTKSMTKNGLASYYKKDFSTIVFNIGLDYMNRNSVEFVYNKSDGAVAKDKAVFAYGDEERQLYISVGIVTRNLGQMVDMSTYSESKIMNTNVLLAGKGKDSSNVYEMLIARFNIDGTSFDVTGKNIAIDDFISAIKDIISFHKK